VAVLVGRGGDASARAAKAATSAIPVMFGMGSDPEGRASGNVTGVTLVSARADDVIEDPRLLLLAQADMAARAVDVRFQA
jgi:hypothetical protein